MNYSASSAGVTVRLWNNTASGGDADGDTLSGIENVAGSSSNDLVIESDASNFLWGGLGDDFLEGLAGNDLLDGGAGNDRLADGLGEDVLSGGSGADDFIFSGVAAGTIDRVQDFEDGIDAILLSAAYAGATTIAAHAEGSLVSIQLAGGGVWSVIVEDVAPEQLAFATDIFFV